MKRVGDDRSSGTAPILGSIFINEFPRFEKYLAQRERVWEEKDFKHLLLGVREGSRVGGVSKRVKRRGRLF